MRMYHDKKRTATNTPEMGAVWKGGLVTILCFLVPLTQGQVNGSPSTNFSNACLFDLSVLGSLWHSYKFATHLNTIGS